ncbi:MAG: DNA-directed RNA polymerase subunit omega [Candidatus Omnitrophica bacterium]|nr:DNA-directed RNA polymerase subunit omega [Candidatus Omnitrophota bacterium]
MLLEEHVPVEHLLRASKGSVYKLTILAAKRALQIADGDKILLDKPSEKCLDNALREILAGKIKVK